MWHGAMNTGFLPVVFTMREITILSMEHPDLVNTFFGEAWCNALFSAENTKIINAKNSQWYTSTGVKLNPEVYESII